MLTPEQREALEWAAHVAHVMGSGGLWKLRADALRELLEAEDEGEAENGETGHHTEEAPWMKHVGLFTGAVQEIVGKMDLAQKVHRNEARIRALEEKVERLERDRDLAAEERDALEQSVRQLREGQEPEPVQRVHPRKPTTEYTGTPTTTPDPHAEVREEARLEILEQALISAYETGYDGHGAGAPEFRNRAARILRTLAGEGEG